MDSYLLKPNDNRMGVEDLPRHQAVDMLMMPPQSTNLNYGDRPNTMLYGTAPYMAGKGPDTSRGILLEDELRPQSTSRFNRNFVDNTTMRYFPFVDMKCSQPLRVISRDPMSTTSVRQNCVFSGVNC